MSENGATNGNETEAPPPARRSLARWLTRACLSLAVALAFIALAGAGITALHMRAAGEAPPERHPAVTVATAATEIHDSYRTEQRFVGRLEPARQTDLAFEQAGLVMEVLVDEGDSVAAGDIIARLDTDKLKARRTQLEARRRELEASRTLAALTLDRQANLRDQGWSPQQREDEAKAQVAQLDAAIDQTLADIAMIDIDIAKALLTAPFDGRIAARMIDDGAVISPGTAVASLLEDGRPQVRIGLPPAVAATLDDDRRYRIEFAGSSATGRLVNRRPDLQPRTRTVSVLFDVETRRHVAFGDIATLILETERRERGTWLPLTALKEGAKGLWTVMVVDAASGNGGIGSNDRATVRPVAVEILHTQDERVYVRGPFGSGARVVIDGTNRIVAGQQVALAGG